MTDTMGELPGNYESRLVISACSGVSLVPSAWFRCFAWGDCESNHPFPVEGEQSQPPARERTAEYTFKDPEPARRQGSDSSILTVYETIILSVSALLFV